MIFQRGRFNPSLLSWNKKYQMSQEKLGKMKLKTIKLLFLLTVLIVVKSETVSLPVTATQNSSITDVTPTNFISTQATKTTPVSQNASTENNNISSSDSQDMNNTSIKQKKKTEPAAVNETANKQNKQTSHGETHGKHSVQQPSLDFKQYLSSIQAKSSENKTEVLRNTSNSNNSLMNDAQQQAFSNFMKEKLNKMSMHLLDASQGNQNSTETNSTLNQNLNKTQNSKVAKKNENFRNENKKTDNIQQHTNSQFSGSF